MNFMKKGKMALFLLRYKKYIKFIVAAVIILIAVAIYFEVFR